MSWQSREDACTLATYREIRLPLTLVRGQGSYVFDEGGAKYLDLYGGHAVASIGHAHPRWVEEVQAQVQTLSFYSNAVFSPVRAEAAELLVTHSYESMKAVFFCNSGAEANETAIKIARKATGRPMIVAMEGGFHGRTLGALSTTGFVSLRQRFPQNAEQWTRFARLGDETLFETADPETIAGVLLEPIQSVAGVYAAPAAYYQKLRDFCRQHGICLIFDEVQTGTGRTGEWYAGTLWGVEPDIVTTAKGVAGGIPAGVVIANDWIAGTVQPGDQATTFGGGPLAAAGIRATYRIIRDEGLLERVRTESRRVMAALGRMPGVREVRGYGYLIGVECDRPAKPVQRGLIAQGIIVGTCSQPNTLRLLPPLTLTRDEWNSFLPVLERMLSEPVPG